MCDCNRLERENRWLRQRLQQQGARDYDEDEGEDEYEDSLGEDDYEEPSFDRFDEEPSAPAVDDSDYRRSYGQPGGRLGDGHVKDARRAYRKYNEAITRGVYGEDVWRFAMGEKIKGSDPLDLGMRAVSRFSRAHR
jgi:hypothetical protein